jgi:hypothetical protein
MVPMVEERDRSSSMIKKFLLATKMGKQTLEHKHSFEGTQACGFALGGVEIYLVGYVAIHV